MASYESPRTGRTVHDELIAGRQQAKATPRETTPRPAPAPDAKAPPAGFSDWASI